MKNGAYCTSPFMSRRSPKPSFNYSMVVAGLVAAAPMATSSKLSTKSGTSSSPAEVAPAPTLAPAEALLLANSLAIFFNCVISCGPNCSSATYFLKI
uniref:Uncharacterized protein n=1 Tax=Glossina austeni TaxID=7395 RepID=A0A1A9VJ18_GLOAU